MRLIPALDSSSKVPTPIGGIRSLRLRGGALTNTGQSQGVGSRPETITETLQRSYPADHPIYVVGNDEINSGPLYVESTASEEAGILPEFARRYLCLVIPAKAIHADSRSRRG